MSMSMSTRHLLTLSPLSPATARLASTVSFTPPQPRRAINYTTTLFHLNSNHLKQLQNPNPNPNLRLYIYKHTSPRATLTDHLTFPVPETRVTTLPNGLRVATTDSILDRHLATVCVWIDTGSRFETEETCGVAHFLQRVLCGWTSKRRSCRDLEEEIKSAGGRFCGGSAREQTLYSFVNVKAGDVAKALYVLSDMLQNSVFDERVIEVERIAIVKDFEEGMLQPEKVVSAALNATAFQGTPIGRNDLVEPESIMSITKKDMQDYLSTHYTPHRMVVTVSGAVKHEDIVEQVNKMFTKLSTNPVTTAQLVEKEPAIFTASEIRKRDDDIPFAHFRIAFKGASWTDPDQIVLRVIETMLGSWNEDMDVGEHNSSLLARMEGIDELAKSVRAVKRQYKDTGLFGVCACAKPERLDDLAFAIMQELSKLCYQVSEEDVNRAQNQLKSLMYRTELNPVEIGEQMLCYGRKVPLAEFFARVDAVDVATVKRVANKYISAQNLTIAAYGPLELLPDYSWFCSRISVLPN